MIDRHVEVSWNQIVATIACLLAWACVIWNFLHPAQGWGFAGMLCITTWGVLKVRGWLKELGDRERNAYELGRDSVRERVRAVR